MLTLYHIDQVATMSRSFSNYIKEGWQAAREEMAAMWRPCLACGLMPSKVISHPHSQLRAEIY